VNFSGEERIQDDINVVWAALHDPELLAKTVPGCRSMTPTGSNSYVVAVSLGVAAVRGEYEGKAKVIDVKTPTHYRVEGEGSGAPGFVKVKADCRLEQQGMETLVRWECDAEVGGLIAGIGGRVLSGTSKFLAKQFFNEFRKELKSRRETGGVAGAASSSAVSGSSRTQRNWFGRLMWFIRRRLLGQATG
jgi:carbon monoxide dehydrogenase subunit G